MALRHRSLSFLRVETILIITAAVLWGCGTGVLVPRLAYRFSLPPEEPWRSACPAGHPLTGIGGGWLGRARCAAGDTYGPSTLSAASGVALVCTVLAVAIGLRPELVVWLMFAPAAVLLAIIDFAVHRLPDVLTLPLAAAVLLLLAVAAALPGSSGSWTSALLGSLILCACYFVLFLLSRGFGFGDVKLALVLGLSWAGTAGRSSWPGPLPDSCSARCTASASCSLAKPTIRAGSLSARSCSQGRWPVCSWAPEPPETRTQS